MTRILLVDDHPIFRNGVRHALAPDLPGAQFGEAGSGAAALELLSAGPWDAVILELGLPGRGGIDLLGEIKRLWPRLPVLVVSGHPEAEFGLRCLQLGASGYLSKAGAPEELCAAVRRVLSGGRYVSAVLGEALARASMGRLDVPIHRTLTTRELQVLRLLARGRSLKSIAAELRLGERTVSTYRARLGGKLGLSTAVELTRFALQHGLAE